MWDQRYSCVHFWKIVTDTWLSRGMVTHISKQPNPAFLVPQDFFTSDF